MELVLKEVKDREARILDLCTGSGCIAISLAALGGFRFVAASDISQEALENGAGKTRGGSWETAGTEAGGSGSKGAICWTDLTGKNDLT